ncbi:MAG: sulfatase-like hydrolase/transferase [Tannerella sp.]|jgi:uncharacterized sulfatase|nr:sulfatase-like hydrolase/transferase [Tannerella sp.]
MKYFSGIFFLSMCSGIFPTGCREKKEEVARRPNILLVINDDQTYFHTGFAGCRFVGTPGFDRVAANGIYFSNCYAGSPGSAPSRSALVTGRHHWQNEQSGQHASSWMKKYVPFVDLLQSEGYHTGYTGKGVEPFRYANDENDSLWRKGNAAGTAFNGYRYTKGDPSDSRTAEGIGLVNYYENFHRFMQQRKAGQPFYFWYGPTEPHRAYEKNSWKRNGKNLEQADVPGFLPDTEEIRGDMLDYAVEIEWADLHLCNMLNYLDSIGELDNTIVIVTADNGMPFPRAKANCFEYGVHVRIDERGVHHPEWAFTDVDAAPSKSFLIENHNDPAIRPHFDLAYGKRPEFELYRITEDMSCLHNLAGNTEYAAIENELKAALTKELTRSGDPRIVGPDKEIFESYIRYSPIRKFPEPDWMK